MRTQHEGWEKKKCYKLTLAARSNKNMTACNVGSSREKGSGREKNTEKIIIFSFLVEKNIQVANSSLSVNFITL